MSYVSISAKLIELLDQITQIEQLYNYQPDSIQTYPAAVVTASGHQDTFRDTAANNRRFTFLIRLYYRTDAEQDAESILQDLTDKVIAKLEANVTVAGVWDILRPLSASWTYHDEKPERIVEITVSAEKRVAR
jgi:hypothetical protein